MKEKFGVFQGEVLNKIRTHEEISIYEVNVYEDGLHNPPTPREVKVFIALNELIPYGFKTLVTIYKAKKAITERVMSVPVWV